MRAWRLGGAAATVALLAMIGLGFGRGTQARPSPPAPEYQPPPPAGAGSGGHMAVGAGSCSAQACHGGVTPMRLPGQVALRNEHTTWITKDKHTRAYQVLTEPRSKSIAKNLAAHSGRPMIPAEKDARCLACHVGPSESMATSATFQGEGVSCESCHGPAGDWFSAHTEITWRNQPDQAKQARGMHPLRDLATRADTCVGCHVGAPADPEQGLLARDVNHDLIAAGHPRLNFELSAYLANEPKHWDTRNPMLPDASPDYEARAWAIGQASTTKAALDLLVARAEDKVGQGGPAPWPEFAEYGCFSCHFSFRKDWREKDPEQVALGGLGLPTWGSWYAPMARSFAVADGNAKVDGSLKAVRAAMSAAAPDRDAAVQAARAAVADLAAWIATLRTKSLDPAQLRAAFPLDDDPTRTEGVYSWDQAVQRYLAQVALSQAQGADAGLAAKHQAILDKLQFPAGFDSPRGWPAK